MAHCCSKLFVPFRFQEVVDWFNAIRSVQFHYLKVAFPIASDNEVRQH